MYRNSVVLTLAAAAAIFFFAIVPTTESQVLDIPSPESVLGFQPGADRELMTYEQLIDYLSQLAEASPRVTLREAGKSPLGRTMYVAFISTPENLENLDNLRSLNQRLALDPQIPEEEREKLIGEGKVFVMEALSMHSGEVAPSQSLSLFAYNMATTEDPKVLVDLQNVVLMMIPCHNPDGMDMVVEHYRKYRGTKYEGTSLPQVYHKYVGHDNNRDFVALTQEDTQVIARLYSTEWYPQVMVEKHQMGSAGPRYYVPPNHDPIAQNVDEGLWNWSAVFGSNLSRDMTADGRLGVASHWLFDDYWPGSTETSLWKNMISFLTEAASCKTATPVFVEPSELSVRGKGLSEYKKGVNMPAPWPGGWWRLADIVSYELSSMNSILATASRHREDILRFRNNLCRKEIHKGRTEAPYYYIMPRDQSDPGALKSLVKLLQTHGVQVHQLSEQAALGDKHFSAGDIVVALAQPYRPFVKEVLEDQRYPERHYTPGGELIRPYDITSWSLPRHMGVHTYELDTRSDEFDSLLAPVDDGTFDYESNLPEDFWAIAYPPTSNDSFKAVFSALQIGMTVARFGEGFVAEGNQLAAGTFVILGKGSSRESLLEIMDAASIPPSVLSSEPSAKHFEVQLPRIALIETSFHDMDAGWTRYVFDTYQIPFKVLHPGDVESAEFAKNFDVVVFPGASKDVLTKGKYKRGDRYMPSDYPPEFRRPISKKGLSELTGFIDGGGIVVSWGSSTGLFTEGLAALPGEDETETINLPVRDISKDLQAEGVSVPGAFLAVDFLKDHPLTWGMPEQGGVFSRGAPVFATSIPSLGKNRRVVASYPEKDILLSGYLGGEKHLRERPVMVWSSLGQGQVVLFGFYPQFRGSVPATFKLVFNSLLLPPDITSVSEMDASWK